MGTETMQQIQTHPQFECWSISSEFPTFLQFILMKVLRCQDQSELEELCEYQVILALQYSAFLGDINFVVLGDDFNIYITLSLLSSILPW